MDVRGEITYGSASPEQVFALAVDRAFRAAVCQATHALSYDVAVDRPDDDTATVTVRRTMPAELPDFVKRFIGETVEVVQIERWAAADRGGQRTGQLTVRVEGQPAAMAGTIAIAADGEGARTVIRGDLKVSIPVVGKRIEPEIARGFVAAIAKEQEVADRWLGAPG
jgi:Protein of unknown function (DUF2505)